MVSRKSKSFRELGRWIISHVDCDTPQILDKKRIARKASYLQEADGELIRCNGLDLIYNEIKIMRQLYHRNIVLLFEVCA